MKAKSIKGTSPYEIKSALQQATADGFEPTLAFVFISIKQDWEAVSDVLDREGVQIFGATTCGEFIDGDIGAGTIAILLMDMDPSNFMVMLEEYTDKGPEASAREMTRKAKAQFKNPSFILSIGFDVIHSSVNVGEPIIRAIESVTGKETIVWGGRAGDDFIFNETVVFSNNQSLKRGILLLVLDGDKILLQGQAASGYKPVGTEKTITRAVDNWVYEIDNQPAAEMVIKYLGLTLTQEEAETFNPGNIVLSLAREKGEPVLRTTGVFNWKNKSIEILGWIKEGDKIRLTLPPDFEIVEEVSRNAEKLRKGEISDVDALLMFSCLSRLEQLGPMIGDEIEGVRKVFNVLWRASSRTESLAGQIMATMNFTITRAAG